MPGFRALKCSTAVYALLLGATGLTHAQQANEPPPAPSSQLPPVVVEKPVQRPVAKPKPQTSTASRAHKMRTNAAQRTSLGATRTNAAQRTSLGATRPQPSANSESSGAASGDPTAYSVPNASTATKTDTPIMDTPASVVVVPQQVLRDQQVITTQQAIENVSGGMVYGGGSISGGRPYSSLILRGFQSDILFRDGTPTYAYGGDTSVYATSFANIQQFEVLKGPAAILYGAVEPGGIVNIVTKQPSATPAYSVQQDVGSYGLAQTTFNATGPLTQDGTFLYRLDGSYLNNNTLVQDTYTRNFFIAPVIQWNISSSDSLKLEFNYRSLVYGANDGFTPLYNGTFLTNYQTANYGANSPIDETTYFAALTYRHEFNQDWSVKARVLYQNVNTWYTGIVPYYLYDTGAPTPSGAAVGRYWGPISGYDRNASANIDLTGHFSTYGVAHTLLFGMDYTRFSSASYLAQANGSATEVDILGNPLGSQNYLDIFNPVLPAQPLFGPASPLGTATQLTNTAGVYLQDQMKLPYNFFLLAGARFQHLYQNENTNLPSFGVTSVNSVADNAVTPRVGLLWRPIEWLSLYGSYVQNFGPAAIGQIEANGNLVPPSKGEQWEAGVKTSLLNDKVTATLAYFDLTKTNIPTTDPNNPLFVTVTGAARNQGVEFDLQGEIQPGWRILTNFAYNYAVVTQSNNDLTPVGSRFGGVPFELYRLWTTYDFQIPELRGLKVGGGINVIGPTPYEPIVTPINQVLPGYATFDLMTAYRFKGYGVNWTAQINAYNIFDRKYIQEAATNGVAPVGPWSAISAIYGQRFTLVGSLRADF